MTIWDTTSATGGYGTGASWSDGDAGGGVQIQTALVPSDFIGGTILNVWFYLNTNVTSSSTDAIYCYVIDSAGATKATSTNSVSRAVITTSFVLHQFTFTGVTIADTDNIMVGFSGASGSGGLAVDGAQNETAMNTFNNYSPSTLNGPWSGQYRMKIEYTPASSGATLLFPPPVAYI